MNMYSIIGCTKRDDNARLYTDRVDLYVAHNNIKDGYVALRDSLINDLDIVGRIENGTVHFLSLLNPARKH